MDPTKESKLPPKVTLLQRHDESNESDDVQGKADDPMVGSEWHELRIGEDDVLNREELDGNGSLS